MKKNEFREEDLYYPLKSYFEEGGFVVKSEVGNCDLMAVKEDLLIIVEMKKSLNLEVILQGVVRQKSNDVVYLAVPKNHLVIKSSKWKNTCHMIKRLGLGLLVVSLKRDGAFIEELIKPGGYIKELKCIPAKKKKLLEEFHNRQGDYNVGGTTRRKLMTAYKEMAIHIAVLLDKRGDMSIKDLKSLGTSQKKTGAILRDNHYGWFDKVSRGVYHINETGKIALNEFPEIVNYYSSKDTLTK